MERKRKLRKLKIKSDHDFKSNENSENVMQDLEAKLKQMSSTNNSSDVLNYLEKVIDSNLTEINFGIMTSLFPEEPDFPFEVFDLIEAKAVNIRVFEVKEIKVDLSPPKIPEELHLGIGKLTTLRKIDIAQFHLEMDELTMMCCDLNNLKYLSVKIDVSLDYFDYDPERSLPKLFRQCFGQLHFFYFTTLGSDVVQQKLTKFCIEHLLSLQGVGAEDCLVDMTLLCKNLSKSSQMRQLMLKMDTFEKEECKFDKFPNVECLFIGWSDSYAYRPIERTKLHFLRNFRKINSLKFENLKSLDYLKFLVQAYGNKVVKLSIASSSGYKKKMLDLKLVQKLLPDLHSLTFFHTKLSPEDCCSLRDFSKLKEISIFFQLDDTREVCLSDLLAPPALENLYLVFLRTSRRELQNTLDKIKRREICGNIKHVHASVIVDGGEKMKRVIQEKGNELVQELRKMKPRINALFDVCM